MKYSFDIANLKNGHYTVGNKILLNKYLAFVEAEKTNQEVKWDFYSDVFKKQIKKPRLNIPLDQIYRMRAEQLRDTYDYVILAFTGGSDSDNILRTFVDNKIRLDEVWFDHPGDLLEKSNYVPNLSKESTNICSEWFYVTQPELLKLQQTNPEIKIHVSDACKESTVETAEEAWEVVYSIQSQVVSSYAIQQRWLYMNKYVSKLRSKHQRVCVITGMEKPIPFLNSDGTYGFIINDSIHPIDNSLVWFYWTPDMPEIVIEQCRAIWDFLKKDIVTTKKLFNKNNEIYQQKIKEGRADDLWRNRSIGLDSIIKKIVYPSWNFTKHQTNKLDRFGKTYYKNALELVKDEKFMQAWRSNWVEKVCQMPKNFIDRYGNSNIMRNHYILGKI